MQQLNFPTYSFRFKNNENKISIFDEIRKKFVILTPEEWVRQNVVRYLLEEKKYSKSYINVEKLIKINDLNKRYDIVVFQPNGEIFLLIESSPLPCSVLLPMLKHCSNDGQMNLVTAYCRIVLI